MANKKGDEALDLKAILDEIRAEVRAVRTDMSQKDDTINKKLDTIQNNIQPMKMEIELHSREIKDLKQEKYRKRLIIFGLDCEPNEPKQILENKLLTLITGTLLLSNFSAMEIDFCKRLGSVTQQKKPILLSLTTERRKMEILRCGKLLQYTSIHIREDLPAEVRAKRKDLVSQMKVYRAQGKFAMIRYDKLIVRDQANNAMNQYQSQTGPSDMAGGQKRALSESPGISHVNKRHLSTYQLENSPEEASGRNADNSENNTMYVETLNDSFLSEHLDEAKN
ncbi:hypothetical protein M8J77_025451 [Diaphorina citri]|nr:hypothetical protein M8J77_025451 [Diaphorina citri]